MLLCELHCESVCVVGRKSLANEGTNLNECSAVVMMVDKRWRYSEIHKSRQSNSLHTILADDELWAAKEWLHEWSNILSVIASAGKNITTTASGARREQ